MQLNWYSVGLMLEWHNYLMLSLEVIYKKCFDKKAFSDSSPLLLASIIFVYGNMRWIGRDEKCNIDSTNVQFWLLNIDMPHFLPVRLTVDVDFYWALLLPLRLTLCYDYLHDWRCKFVCIKKSDNNTNWITGQYKAADACHNIRGQINLRFQFK